MAEPATDAKPLAGHHVTFTGRLASLTRAEAAELVRARGGAWLPSVTRETSMLVVGQEPLRKDGRLSADVRRARALQRSQAVEILAEPEFLDRLGLASVAQGGQRYSTAQLSQILHVPGRHIRAWVRRGLVKPVDTVAGIHYFNFRQVSWAKTLCDLAAAGVSAERIRRSLEQLRTWLPDVEERFEQLAVLEKDGRLLVRLREGQLAEPTGQCLFDFGDEPATEMVPVAPGPQTASDWFQAGCAHEEVGRWADAAHAYRQALLVGGPDAEACFNLGNVLYALGQQAQAAERFHQAVEIEPDSVGAWNNLGSVLADLGQCEDAVGALRQALALEPHYADAHYNLADALDQLGRREEARLHWQAYLRREPGGPWADHARRRLAQTERPKQA
jgi:tetratricopeptide (TPR) repeat protein